MTDSGSDSQSNDGVDTDLEDLVISPVISSAAASLSIGFFYKGSKSTIDSLGTILDIQDLTGNSVLKVI